MKKTIIALATALIVTVPASADLIPLKDFKIVTIGGIDFTIPSEWYEADNYDNDTELTKLFFPPEAQKDGIYNGSFAFSDLTEAIKDRSDHSADAFYIVGVIEAQNQSLGAAVTDIESDTEGEILWVTFTRTYSDKSNVEKFLVFSGNAKAGSLYYTQPTTANFSYDSYFNKFLVDLKYSQYPEIPEIAEILESYSG